MDTLNRFHTRATYALVRTDHVAAMLLMLGLVVANAAEVNWLRFTLAFWWIDLLGYLPGALWYRVKAKNGAEPMPRAFVVLYNVAHNISLNLAITLAWAALLDGFEWAMLAAPIHLCIDRGLFGNIYKTSKLSFEPIANTQFSAFSLALERGGDWPGSAPSRNQEDGSSTFVSEIVSRFSDHPSIGLVFNRGTRYFTVPGVDAFVAYQRRGGTIFCLGGPVGAPAARERLFDAFLSYARDLGCRLFALQVREGDLELFHARGFRLNQMGQSYTLKLAGFSLAGGRFMKLRNKVKQPERAGVSFRELTGNGESPEALARQLDVVSAAWLHAKGANTKELRFLVGEVDSVCREGTRCFGAYREGELIAFISYVPCYGRFAGYMHDLTRRRPDCPPGTLEAINLRAIASFQKEGVEHLCFGFTPLVGITDKHPSHSRLVARLLQLMAERAPFIYPAKSQEAYKRKWYPEFVEPEYMAFRGRFALGQLWNFLRLTRSI